jgi:hypothetical protein
VADPIIRRENYEAPGTITAGTIYAINADSTVKLCAYVNTTPPVLNITSAAYDPNLGNGKWGIPAMPASVLRSSRASAALRSGTGDPADPRHHARSGRMQ